MFKVITSVDPASKDRSSYEMKLFGFKCYRYILVLHYDLVNVISVRTRRMSRVLAYPLKKIVK